MQEEVNIQVLFCWIAMRTSFFLGLSVLWTLSECNTIIFIRHSNYDIAAMPLKAISLAIIFSSKTGAITVWYQKNKSAIYKTLINKAIYSLDEYTKPMLYYRIFKCFINHVTHSYKYGKFNIVLHED